MMLIVTATNGTAITVPGESEQGPAGNDAEQDDHGVQAEGAPRR